MGEVVVMLLVRTVNMPGMVPSWAPASAPAFAPFSELAMPAWAVAPVLASRYRYAYPWKRLRRGGYCSLLLSGISDYGSDSRGRYRYILVVGWVH